MSEKGRLLQVGDLAITDYGFSAWQFPRKSCRVKIMERLENERSQSHILFSVVVVDGQRGRLKEESYYDADWFDPIDGQV